MSDQPTVAHVDRAILVFSIWAVLGFFGLGVLLEGFRLDQWSVSAGGVLLIMLAFVAHIVVNAIFDTGFSQGEAALGFAAYGLLGLVFIAGALGGRMSMTNYYSGLTLFGLLAAGFLAYLFTRHGLRGAFSRFHVKTLASRELGR